MKGKKNWTKWLYWFVFAIAVIFVYKTLDNLNDISVGIGKLVSILMPFIIGILLSYIFYIPCRKIEQAYKKVKFKFIQKRARGLAVISVYILAVIVLVIIINILIPALSKSIVDLANNLPRILSKCN